MKQASRQLFLGVDGGGTKTRAVVADRHGRVLADLRGPASNFQFMGTPKAKRHVVGLLRAVAGRVRAKRNQWQAAFYGMAGADRESDQAHIRRWLAPISPAKRFRVAADPIPMLRLASPDGSGVAVVVGTGANCIGVDSKGRECAVGGWIGSWAGGGEIGMRVVNAAVEAEDGRGPATVLAKLLCRRYSIRRPTDLLDWVYADKPRGRVVSMVELAPLAFQAAKKGDRVAKAILRQQGGELFRMARQVRKTLFKPGRPLVIAMGGSLLQRAEPPLIRKTFEKQFRAFHPKARFKTPDKDPAYGALLLAYDLAGVPAPEKALLGETV